MGQALKCGGNEGPQFAIGLGSYSHDIVHFNTGFTPKAVFVCNGTSSDSKALFAVEGYNGNSVTLWGATYKGILIIEDGGFRVQCSQYTEGYSFSYAAIG